MIHQGTYLSLKQTNLDAVFAKLQSIDSEMGAQKLSDGEMNTLSLTLGYLSNPSGNAPDQTGVGILVKLCATLPPAKRFPALDLLRLFVLYAPTSVSNAVPDGDVVEFLRNAGGLAAPNNDKISTTNAMLAYRGLANLFILPQGRELAWPKRNVLSEVLQPDVFSCYVGKPARLAISTLAVK